VNTKHEIRTRPTPWKTIILLYVSYPGPCPHARTAMAGIRKPSPKRSCDQWASPRGQLASPAAMAIAVESQAERHPCRHTSVKQPEPGALEVK
jgi:hypothetical protein